VNANLVGDEVVFSDPMAGDGHRAWRDDPKTLEGQMASSGPYVDGLGFARSPDAWPPNT
jgi:hypothetical protein